MSVGGVLATLFSPGALACSHCGSSELYPCPGPLGALAGILGRVRYACRACRRHSWLRPDAEVPRQAADDLGLEAPTPIHATASLDALDINIEAVPVQPTCTDLRALDDALATNRRGRCRRKR
jgi:hypothetical protein